MLRALLLEDSPRDAEIIRELLIDAGFDLEMDCTASEKEFVSLLRSRPYDIILSDFNLHGFDGFTALRWAMEICPNVPFICVSGTIGEEAAVDLLVQGAADYVLKDRLAKLPSAIHRALAEVKEKEQRRKAEAALRKSEENFRRLFESSRDAIMTMEPPFWKFTTGNPATVKMFNAKNEEEFVTHGPWELSPDRQPDGRVSAEKSVEMIETAIREGFHFFEWTHRRIDGKEFLVDVLLTRMEQNGKMIIQATIRDITERKRVEVALVASEKRFRDLYDNAPNAYFSVGVDGRIRSCNTRAGEMLGYGAEKLVGRPIGELYADTPNGKEKSKKALDRFIAGQKVQDEELQMQKADGTPLWISLTVNAIRDSKGNIVESRSMVVDITDRKQTEEALGAERNLLRTLIDNLPDRVYIKDVECRFLLNNIAHIKALGAKSQEEVVGKTDLDFRPRELADRYMADDRSVIETGVPLINREEQMILGSGDGGCLLSTKVPVCDQKGKTIGLVGISRDITNRKQAELELVRLRLGIERSSDAVFVTDKEGVIQYVNPAFQKIYGYNSNDACGQTPRILKSGKSTPSDYKQFWSTLLSKKAVIAEIDNKRKDGCFISVEVSNNPILDRENHIIGFMGIHRDITLRKQSEEKEKSLEGQLRQVQKLESIGTLASGIAHDFNNILGIILGYSTLLERLREDPKGYSESIAAITKATKRGASLVKQLLIFARKTEVLIEVVNINDMIEELTKFMGDTFPKTIKICTSLQKGLPAIVADTSQIHQVLLNLFVNARDAMPNSGTLSISTRTIDGKAVSSRTSKVMRDRMARQYVEIEVADSGTGMDEATRQRIFEPFFTTKSPGKGTGLGLSVVFGIVEHHCGFIDVRSALGKGTSFSVLLPIPDGAAVEAEAGKKSNEDIRGGTETILVIEDEEMLRALLRAFLVAKGYVVLTADDGVQGVEMYRKHQKEIAIVVSDMGLPLLNGHDVFRKIRNIEPKAKVIFASGFIEPETKSDLRKNGLINFIQKPYMHDEVLQKIREAIDAKG